MGMAYDAYYSTKSQNSSLVWPTKLRGVGDEESETRPNLNGNTMHPWTDQGPAVKSLEESSHVVSGKATLRARKGDAVQTIKRRECD